MRGTDLRHANLGLDNIGGITRLRDVDLSGADLRNACLAGADLTGAKLVGADLRGVLAVCHVPGKQPAYMGQTSPRPGLPIPISKPRSTIWKRGFRRGFDRKKRHGRASPQKATPGLIRDAVGRTQIAAQWPDVR